MIVAALLTGGACNALDSLIATPTGNPVATIGISTTQSGTVFNAIPIAFFYRPAAGSSVQFTAVGTVQDACNVRHVAGGIGVVVDTMPTAAIPLDVGPAILMTLSGTTDSLVAPSSQTVGYKLRAAAGRPFNPGDTATFSIGANSAGIPATSVSLKTAEAFTMAPLIAPASGVDLPVTWTPATTPGSAMNLTLTWQTPPVITQIYCQFVDDGQAAIPASLLAEYPDIATGKRLQGGSIDAIRLRATLVQPAGSKATLNAASTFHYSP